ncbi:ABC transporter ATP-binding protein [Dactylosporangium sp. AC04546]|uniref:ABC transporter ATP-binding protein n=1 Tax=Dactylosporangium sp. AC04546 TaxID=2862460 RepID=UPI00271468A6|nr:ABC transporter ATP-binding protein [Dactylosporangium sp. AC04546]WVK79580.1 ABC transporter ATP-binding protein [Dactylosporangium sp. AC04546]
MPAIAFRGIRKSYGDTPVIHEFSTDIPDREFLVLLGPSGCGKSTMLRMIAGLIDISDGDLLFDGQRVNDLEPRQRNVAFVFQSYALYPHKTVRANIAFPLLMSRFRWWQHIPLVGMVARWRAMRDPAIAGSIERIAATMELTPYLDRRPRTLSGGQRQRVALARALVREPSIYLLDEPLSNLDAKLRAQMRTEITALHRRVGASFIYVTHDQVEAMTMGTRIILLNDGVVQQHGTPQEIYDRPANTFVARFIGSPAMNLLPVTVQGGQAPIDGGAPVAAAGVPDGPALLGVRPEKVRLAATGLPARVVVVERLGAETIVGFRLGLGTGGPGTDESGTVRDVHYAKVPGNADLAVDDECRVQLDLTGACWFDVTSGERVA